MNPFKDVLHIEKDGRIFTLHWKNRHGPVAIPLMIAGTALSAYSQIQQSRAQASSMEAQADAAEVQAQNEQTILEHNAKLEERAGEAKLERGREAARQFGAEAEALKATGRVNAAKGGILTTVGTAPLVFEETAKELEADRMTILKNAFLEQSFSLSQAQNLRLQGASALSRGQTTAANLRTGASSVKTGGYLSAGGTLLSGFGTAGALKGSALTRTGGAGTASKVSQTSSGPTPLFRTR